MVKKVEFSRSMNQCSLIITAEEDSEIENDSIEMFRYQKIPCFLNFHMQKKDNAIQFSYDITGMQSLKQALESQSLNYKLVKMILNCFDQACIQAAQYMLTENDIALLPELLYLNMDSNEALFCYLPGNQIHICVQFKKFMEYLMRHLDHKDKQAVQLVYGVYQQVSEEKSALHFVLQNAESEWEKLINGNEREKEGQKSGLNVQNGYGVRGDCRIKNRVLDNRGSENETIKNEILKDRISKNETIKNEILKNERSRNNDKENGEFEEEGFWKEQNGVVYKKDRRALQKKGIEKKRLIKKKEDGVWKENWMEKDAVKKAGAEGKRIEKGEIKKGEIKKGKIRKNATEKKNMDGKTTKTKLLNFFRKKIYTDSYQKMEDEAFFGARTQESAEYGMDALKAQKTDVLQNKFIYQGLDRNRDFSCLSGKKVLGSSKEYADICIPLPMISKVHARIEVNEKGTFLEDMNTANGTQVNGETLKYREKRILKKGDMISLAGENYHYC